MEAFESRITSVGLSSEAFTRAEVLGDHFRRGAAMCYALGRRRATSSLSLARADVGHHEMEMPKKTSILVMVAAFAAAIVAFPPVREPVLRAAGWALVINEPVAPADIIVVSLDSGGAGALEAADLVRSGIATRVAVFTDPPSGEDHEFIRRGLPYEDASARQIRQLRWLGVTDIMQIPGIEVGTEGEGQVLPPWCDQHRFGSIVFVAARDHSRRLRRVLNRIMKGHSTRITVQSARYSKFDPDRWWETRDGIRTEIVEFQKLLLEVALHPLSF
jgi:hypothetical protein